VSALPVLLLGAAMVWMIWTVKNPWRRLDPAG
jgi:hypothetical protein